MALNIRRVGEVADGSVTSAKLADGAVDLGSGQVVGQVPSSKIEDSAVIEQKLANLAISTSKLKDNTVTLAKASDDVKLKTFIGDETEVSVSGVTEVGVKEFRFPKHASAFIPLKFRVIATLKTDNVSYNAILKIFIDEEVDARISFTSTSTDYELVGGEFDISDLGNGVHLVKVILASEDASSTAYSDMIDALLVS